MSNFVMMFFVLFSHLETEAFSPSYAKTPNCAAARKNFMNRFAQLKEKYHNLSEVDVSEENSPTWNWGRKKQAVYLLHGFIGTPNEMSALAVKLQVKGFTVINDLIPGYAADGFVANQFKPQQWQENTEANLESIRSCFEKIHLVGFSTGGLLLHDYVRLHEEDFTARSLILYSPFYRPHLKFADLLRSAARLVTPVVLIQPLYYLTRFPDIKVAVLKPNNYLQQLPLDGARFVFSLGRQVHEEIRNLPLGDDLTATLLFVSDTDRIMDLQTSVENVTGDFSNVSVVRFSEIDVPHHLMVDAVSPVAEAVQDQTVDFILAH